MNNNIIGMTDILDALNSLERVGITPRAPQRFSALGLDFHVSDHVRKPKMKLSPKMMEILEPKFAADFNKWLDEFFGAEDRVYMISGLWGAPTFVLSPQSVVMLDSMV